MNGHRTGIGRQAVGYGRNHRYDGGHLDRSTAAQSISCYAGSHATNRIGQCRKCYGQRCVGSGGHGTDGTVAERNTVVFRCRAKSEAIDDKSGCVGCQVGRTAGHHGLYSSHIDGRTATGTIGRDHSRQDIGGSWFGSNVTVSDVAVAAVTVPTALSLKTTVLLAAVVSKPNPLIVSVVALASKSLVLLVTTGTTVATCTAVPLVFELTVTIAVKLPAAVGSVESVTVSEVAVAAVTLPTAPLLNSMVLLAAVGSKPCPVIVSAVALAAKRLPAFAFTTGASVAICTAEPLDSPLEVTMAVRLPEVCGFFENVTVNAVALALVTSPMAPLFNTTELLVAVASNPKPLMTMVVALANRSLVLLVTTGVTVATCTAGPLEMLFEVTTAVKLPALVGFVEKVTVNDVAVAAVTVPTAPLLNTTELLAAVKSKPVPLMVIVLALAASPEVLLVTTGRVVAT